MSHPRRAQSDRTEMSFCCYPACRADADPRLNGEPMCLRHAVRMHLTVRDHAMPRYADSGIRPTEEQERASAMRHATRSRVEGRGAPTKGRPGLIYYMRFGNQVKIGWTSNIKGRIEALRPDEVLATEDGTLADEKARHMQFGTAWLEREMFALTPPLLAHIKALR